MTGFYVHPLAEVLSDKLGKNTKIWQFVVVLPGARIGSDCNICSHCFLENDVVIGDRVTIKNGVQLWDGLTIENDVFVGPNVTFTNDKFPRSKHFQEPVLKTHIEAGSSLGAGATILPGLRIGRNAMVGSGAVVTRSVPSNAIVVGNPARIVGYVDVQGKPHRHPEHLDVEAAKPTVDTVKLIKLPKISDIRGSLTVGEFEKSIPFDAKRYFLVFDVPSIETRGEHAHRECEEFLICVRGRVSVVVDNGRAREEFLLDRIDVGLYISPMTWLIQYKYSSDAILLVFASRYYDSSDYIRNYDEFLSTIRTQR